MGDGLEHAGETSGPDPTATERLRAALHELEAALRRAESEPIPSDEPGLVRGPRLRRAVRRREFRMTRPLSRRYDRIGAEVAGLSARLAEQLAETQVQVEMLRRSLAARAPATAAEPAEDADAYYWSFEERMRGSAESIAHRLRQYEELAVGLLDRVGRRPAPLWLDIGCGRGEFLALLSEWGWRVRGVDSSRQAVEACRARGIDAVQADVFEYLAAREGEAPAGMSAIQVIEHLPKDQWLGFFQIAHGALRAGGGLLVETLNPMNPKALADSFFADISHTWPAHPQTLRSMAEEVGFGEVKVMYVNDDPAGSAQDFAIWAMA